MLEGYVRALSGMRHPDCLSLTVGGKPLRQPDRLLRKSALAPYSLFICDFKQLKGGMQASQSKKKKKSQAGTPKRLQGLSAGKSKRKPSRGKETVLTSPKVGNHPPTLMAQD